MTTCPRRSPSRDAFAPLPLCMFERTVLRAYALAALTPQPGESEVAIPAALADWYGQNRHDLGLSVPALDAALAAPCPPDPVTVAAPAGATAIADEESRSSSSELQERLDWMAQTLLLPPSMAAFLAAVTRLTALPAFNALARAAAGGSAEAEAVGAGLAARLAGVLEPEAAGRRLRAALIDAGLLDAREGDGVALSGLALTLLTMHETRH